MAAGKADDPCRNRFFRFIAENLDATFHHALAGKQAGRWKVLRVSPMAALMV
jgi:hypothetical protein